LRSLVFLPDRIIQLGPSVPTRRSSDLDDGVFHAHFLDCLGNALRLICIVFGGTSRGDSAECAASRTNISQDHKRSRTRSPAFTHVGAIAAFANSVQLVLVHHPPHLGILRANRKFDPKPVGFLSAWLVAYNRKLDHICSLFFMRCSGVLHTSIWTPLFVG